MLKYFTGNLKAGDAGEVLESQKSFVFILGAFWIFASNFINLPSGEKLAWLEILYLTDSFLEFFKIYI